MTSTEPLAKVIPYTDTVRQRALAVMFVDLDRFMQMCVEAPPETVFGLLGDFQHLVADLVLNFGGELNAYQGDGVLATFGDLAERADCATRTLRCARRILEQIRLLSLDYANGRGPSISVSIGLQYGQVWTHTLHTSRRFGPTLIGDAINVAARLEQQAGVLGADIVVGEALVQRARSELSSSLSDLAHFVNAGPVFVHGRSTPVNIWKLQR
jgi:adenylate cyclase